MRILMVSHGYPPWGLAGVERVTQQTATALSGAGHAVTVLSRRATPAPPLPRVERPRQAGGVRVAMVGGGADPPAGPFPGHHDRMERIFEQLLLEVLPEVVIVGHLSAHSPGYVQVAHRWGIPVMLELHDFYTVCERAHLERPSGALCRGPERGRACARHCFAEQDDAAGRWALRTHLFALALADADALVCPSRFVADYFRDRGVAEERVRVIPNGIAFARRSLAGGAEATQRARREPLHARPAPAGSLHLASLGVATPHKGQHVVVDALRKARLPAARYTLFGALTQPYTRDLRALADESAGVELRTYGPYDPSALPALLADVDAVIVPSLVWETFSIVAREALACGVPVIASRLGALPEAVREDENGLLFTPGASAELAELLQRLDADRSALARLRAGIDPGDWITVGERTRRLEGVLEEIRDECSARVRDARSAQPAGTAQQPDLGALRGLLATTP
jgi:glycosyltransferase involved in cell wall biosynthesis